MVEEKRCPLRLTPSGGSSTMTDPHLSICRQCELLGLNRSTYYLPPAVESEEDLRLMRLIDEQYLKTPFYGSRRMTAFLERRGEAVNRKRVQRLMALDGPGGARIPSRGPPSPTAGARAYPYLLRDRVLTRVDEVWSSDITYVPMRRGFMYLTAVIDWYSRYVLSWRLSNTLDVRVLPGGAGRGVVAGPAGDLQHRPGVAVHVAGVHRPAGGGRGRGEPGRSGACAGQRVRGAAVEEREIRRHLHQRL